MNYVLKIVCAALALIVISCSQQKEKPLLLSEAFKGEWIHVDQKTKKKSFINFNADDFQSTLSTSGDSIQGKWIFNNEDSTLNLTIFTNGFEAKVDSSMIRINDGNVEFVHYSGGEQIVLEDASAISPLEEIKYQTNLKDNHLILSNANRKLAFHRKVITEKSASLSFNISSILRGILGMAVLILIAWLFSMNRKKINWGLIGKGLLLQAIIAILVLKVPAVEAAFSWISGKFVELIAYTDDGVNFLFGQFGVGVVQAPLLTFAIKVLPTIIFFSALVSLLYYWGILQKIVYAFAWIMKKFMRLSGAESLAAAGNVFLGQTEAPLLVKPYLLGMTKSEIMCLMTGGMATIAGGVLAAYVSFLGGDDPAQQAFFAKHLLTASIISAPAAIIAAKILVPETEEINEDLKITKEKIGTNALEAITNGTTDGLRLAVNVGAMLLVFIALMALANGILHWIGDISGLNESIAAAGVYSGLSFEFLLGYTCRPIVWLMGVDWADSIYVGELLGTKTVLNEFVAYPRLGEMKDAGMLSEKSVIMSTYMLCGFANVASIGIQIGGIGSLAPTRKGLLSKLGVRALIGGTVACLMTAVIVGMTL